VDEDSPVSTYVRPVVAPRTFLDDDGRPIAYGTRWSDDGPPEESYSAESHLERFAPLHDVADALVSHLRETFDVSVRESDGPGEEGRRSFGRSVDSFADPATRSVLLTPSLDSAAPLEVVFTDHPGIAVRAGVLYESTLPPCGCDACDETWQSAAERLESLVLSVVSGGFREWVGKGLRPWCGYAALDADGGGESGLGYPDPVPRTELRRARERLRALPGGRKGLRLRPDVVAAPGAWSPWPRRS
jgi:hypothetical protein